MDLTRLTRDAVFARAELLISHVVVSPESQRAYQRAIRTFIDWWGRRQETCFDKDLIYRYRLHLLSRNLAPATINQQLTAIRTLAIELGDHGILSPTVAAAITRIKGVKSHGIRIGQWLSQTDVQRLLNTPNRTTLKGKRDRALLAIATGCGLRRVEIAQLTVQTIQERSGRWVLVDIRGKQNRIRSIPMASETKAVLDEWLAAAAIDSGCVFRAVDKAGRVHGNGISGQAVYEIIKGYGVDIGIGIAPHDLRRSFARIAHCGDSPLEQIQFSLGHASVATTERYVGAKQNLIDAPCDRLGLSLFAELSSVHPDDFPLCLLSAGVVHMPATGFAYVDGGGRLCTVSMKPMPTCPATSECTADKERARQLAAALESW